MLQLKSIKERPVSEWRGKKVLVRLDLDVPLRNGAVTDDFRLRRALPTLNFLLDAGADLTIIGHLGRRGESIAPVRARLVELAGRPLRILENLRRDGREEANKPAFAAELAVGQEIFVNEAFAVCHRAHASVVGLPALLPSYAGLNLQAEVENLSRALNPPRPSLLILGGAKFETKAPLLQKFLLFYDTIFIGGALANNFFKARGEVVGQSLVDENWEQVRPFLNEPKIKLPADKVISDDKILDIGPQAVEELKALIAAAKFTLWSGPLGNFENEFGAATESIVGGGDTLAALAELNLLESFTFVSTGGGAMLEFLAQGGVLPGLEALAASQQKFEE